MDYTLLPGGTHRLSRAERRRNVEMPRESPRRKELLALLTQYDITAPRYTSYPPATLFQPSFKAEDYLRTIRRVALREPAPEISLYVHLPFCDTLCYFCGCTMMISNNRAKIAEYVEYLKREATMLALKFISKPRVVQLHWGGGTPTHLLPEEMIDLMSHLRTTFDFVSNAEVSIEIDPRGLSEAHFEALRQAGFNRASLGVQDISEDVQAAINRVQPLELTREVIRRCRESGVDSLNLDLIYGLPYQTTTSFRATLHEIVNLDPERIAIYNFAYMPWLKPHQALIPAETLPEPSTKMALLELAIHELTENDYEYLGMDHFAKSTDALACAMHQRVMHRNFQGYSTQAGLNLFGLGVSAIGHFADSFAQNTKELEEYYECINQNILPIEKGYEMTSEDRLREFVIMRLMCQFSISSEEVWRKFRVNFSEHFASALQDLICYINNGLAIVTEDGITITELGRYFLRNIALCFDQYSRNSMDEKRFSRTV